MKVESDSLCIIDNEDLEPLKQLFSHLLDYPLRYLSCVRLEDRITETTGPVKKAASFSGL